MKLIAVNVTEDQARAVLKKAQQASKSMSGYLRDLLGIKAPNRKRGRPTKKVAAK